MTGLEVIRTTDLDPVEPLLRRRSVDSRDRLMREDLCSMMKYHQKSYSTDSLAVAGWGAVLLVRLWIYRQISVGG